MKLFFLLISVVLISQLASAQKFSGLSTSTTFDIPQKDARILSGLSKPIQMKIRQGSTFAALSIPTIFIIDKRQASSSEISQVRTIKKQEIGNSSLPEIDENLPRYYSLIIGVDDYIFNDTRLQDLSMAVSDAKSLSNTLIKDFNFSKENAFFLENPSRKQIIEQLENLAHKITPKDNLLIFYAGHGFWDERIKVGYWLPSDAKSNDKSNWISNSTIRDYIAGINSKHTLLITDACFGGSIFKTRDMDLSDYAMSNLYRLSSRKAMTSGTLTTVPDESKFMRYFLKRLNDTEGKYISARQLFYGLETAVLNNSHTVPQFGVIQDTGDEGGDFIFIKRR